MHWLKLIGVFSSMNLPFEAGVQGSELASAE
jgi:hypothetical protein